MMTTEADLYRQVSIPSFVILLIALLSVLSCTSSPVQQVDVPELITSRFKAMYPDARDIQWSLNGNAYEVAFNFKKTEFKMLFLEDGGVEWTKTKTALTSIPAGISSYAETNLSGQSISEVMRVVNGFGVVTWEVKAGTKNYLFNESGAFLGILQ